MIRLALAGIFLWAAAVYSAPAIASEGGQQLDPSGLVRMRRDALLEDAVFEDDVPIDITAAESPEETGTVSGVPSSVVPTIGPPAVTTSSTSTSPTDTEAQTSKGPRPLEALKTSTSTSSTQMNTSAPTDVEAEMTTRSSPQNPLEKSTYAPSTDPTTSTSAPTTPPKSSTSTRSEVETKTSRKPRLHKRPLKKLETMKRHKVPADSAEEQKVVGVERDSSGLTSDDVLSTLTGLDNEAVRSVKDAVEQILSTTESPATTSAPVGRKYRTPEPTVVFSFHSTHPPKRSLGAFRKRSTNTVERRRKGNNKSTVAQRTETAKSPKSTSIGESTSKSTKAPRIAKRKRTRTSARVGTTVPTSSSTVSTTASGSSPPAPTTTTSPTTSSTKSTLEATKSTRKLKRRKTKRPEGGLLGSMERTTISSATTRLSTESPPTSAPILKKHRAEFHKGNEFRRRLQKSIDRKSIVSSESVRNRSETNGQQRYRSNSRRDTETVDFQKEEPQNTARKISRVVVANRRQKRETLGADTTTVTDPLTQAFLDALDDEEDEEANINGGIAPSERHLKPNPNHHHRPNKTTTSSNQSRARNPIQNQKQINKSSQLIDANSQISPTQSVEASTWLLSANVRNLAKNEENTPIYADQFDYAIPEYNYEYYYDPVGLTVAALTNDRLWRVGGRKTKRSITGSDLAAAAAFSPSSSPSSFSSTSSFSVRAFRSSAASTARTTTELPDVPGVESTKRTTMDPFPEPEAITFESTQEISRDIENFELSPPEEAQVTVSPPEETETSTGVKMTTAQPDSDEITVGPPTDEELAEAAEAVRQKEELRRKEDEEFFATSTEAPSSTSTTTTTMSTTSRTTTTKRRPTIPPTLFQVFGGDVEVKTPRQMQKIRQIPVAASRVHLESNEKPRFIGRFNLMEDHLEVRNALEKVVRNVDASGGGAVLVEADIGRTLNDNESPAKLIDHVQKALRKTKKFERKLSKGVSHQKETNIGETAPLTPSVLPPPPSPPSAPSAALIQPVWQPVPHTSVPHLPVNAPLPKSITPPPRPPPTPPPPPPRTPTTPPARPASPVSDSRLQILPKRETDVPVVIEKDQGTNSGLSRYKPPTSKTALEILEIVNELRRAQGGQERPQSFSVFTTSKQSYFILPNGRVLVVAEESKLAKHKIEDDDNIKEAPRVRRQHGIRDGEAEARRLEAETMGKIEQAFGPGAASMDPMPVAAVPTAGSIPTSGLLPTAQGGQALMMSPPVAPHPVFPALQPLPFTAPPFTAPPTLIPAYQQMAFAATPPPYAPLLPSGTLVSGSRGTQLRLVTLRKTRVRHLNKQA